MSPLPSREEPGTQTLAIRTLNDQLRKWPLPPLGEMLITPGIMQLSSEDGVQVLRKVAEFDAFTEDNDPHGEHDFGAIDHNGSRYFWKIDYYDLQKEYHSPDAADPDVTCRVLTVMRADKGRAARRGASFAASTI